MPKKNQNEQSVREKAAIGRPKRYTATGLRKAVEDYFASISYMVDVTRTEPVILSTDPDTGAVTYLFDESGHVMTRQVPVVDGDGVQMRKLVYAVPPGKYALCEYLGISVRTWDRYGEDENVEFRRIYARAGGRICAYLEEAAEGKHGGGARYKLDRIYGMNQKLDVSVTGGLEEYLKTIPGPTEF